MDTDLKRTAVTLIKEIKKIKEDKELHKENDLKDNKHPSYAHKNTKISLNKIKEIQGLKTELNKEKH